ncbi:class I SAM-dependent methyltransferase [Luteipulveratus mongoliensis]|uniref:Methyltransferase type 11 n=1 Tax=Luteipulveratus mongoliensis TaxID=571913 RepID=A0A0K1JM70_9MICO|nr:class I SAM-dependent methyltransferase [Luteipulveratus mongoliensis]AKU17685.1 methyltransferase type 11 [Luteipulveratus mongoliensis]
MADREFEDPRLAALYDPLDPDRSDLEVYADIAREFGAQRVLDIGCGTGTFACLLAERGFDGTGVDPAEASLDVAQAKPYADRVRWVHGDATTVPDLQVDLAVMTANVAHVFLTDEEWLETLRAARRLVRPGGRLVFETRVPARRAWESWTREKTYGRAVVPGVGEVEYWNDVVEVQGDPDVPTAERPLLVTFHGGVVVKGESLESDSTLRFRSREEIETSLAATGFAVEDVRDAPDRPGYEWVFVCR